MKACKVDGCCRLAKRRGWCDTHYHRALRAGEFIPKKIRKKGEGNVNNDGYIRKKCPKTGKLKFEHVLVMEKALGRELKPWEEIHHIDGNRRNNDLNNLLVFPDHASHLYWHAIEKWYKETGRTDFWNRPGYVPKNEMMGKLSGKKFYQKRRQ